MSQPSEEVLRRRKIVGINSETVSNITSKDFPGHYPGEDNSWDIEQIRNAITVQFHKNTPNLSIFSLVGVDASTANAFRRILLSELPTLAIEDVFIEQNTSIIQDEVLAHRLGLVPLRANRDGLRWLKWRRRANPEENQPADPATDFNTIVLKLQVKCEWADKGIERARKGETDPDLLYKRSNVYARDLEFCPIGQQADTYFTPRGGPVEPVNPDILLAKLRPGQELDITLHAVLGAGGDHAKFSPVATASYRLLPTITILRPITGASARKFARCFPKGVIGLEAIKRGDAETREPGVSEGDVKAVVKDAMADTVSRECLRHDEFQGKVELGRRRDHFVFSVESTGQWEAAALFLDSVRVLRRKCERLQRQVADLR